MDDSVTGDGSTELGGVARLPANSRMTKLGAWKANIYSSKIKDFRSRKRRMGECTGTTISDDEGDPGPIPVDSQPGQTWTLRPRSEPLVDVTASVQEMAHGEDWTPPPPAASKPAAKKGRKQMVKLLRELEAAKSQLSINTLRKEDDECYVVDEEDGDRDVAVKMRWQSSIRRIPMKQNQKFLTVFPLLAAMCDALPSEIVISFHDGVNVRPDDTPASLRLTVADILDCGVLKPDSTVDDVPSKSDSRTVELKVQAVDRKSKASVRTNKFDPLSTLMTKYAQMQGLDASTLAFFFDGDRLDPSSTPADLDMEDGDCIDVRTRTSK